MDVTAFGLRPEYNLEELAGATIAFGQNAYTFDIKGALDAGNGVIVTDDPDLSNTLSYSPLLQGVKVPKKYDIADTPEGYVAPDVVTAPFQGQGGVPTTAAVAPEPDPVVPDPVVPDPVVPDPVVPDPVVPDPVVVPDPPAETPSTSTAPKRV